MENNKSFEVAKDDQGYYKKEEENSIIIQVQMLGSKEIYPMEKIYALGTVKFVEYFNTSLFK